MTDISFKENKLYSKNNLDEIDMLENYFQNSTGTISDKLDNFPKYVTRTSMARFLTRFEIFKKVLDVQGVVVECGVLFGGSLLSWGHFSSILEPSNHQRRIYGFDTFEGFSKISEEDMSSNTSELCKEGDLAVDSEDDLRKGIRIFDKSRYFNHVPKIDLVRGNVLKTVPKFLEKHKHLIVSLLYMDLDIFEPTRFCLTQFLPRMPKDSIIAFDQLNNPQWPGETQALFEVCNLDFRQLKIKKIGYGTSISYVQL
jgi:hypothetical protein